MTADQRALVAFTTCADQTRARALARELVEQGLAGCVNIVPQVRSIYRWQGELCDDPESLLMIKTCPSAMPALKEALARMHNYDVPELIALNIVDGSEDYLAWLRTQLA